MLAEETAGENFFYDAEVPKMAAFYAGTARAAGAEDCGNLKPVWNMLPCIFMRKYYETYNIMLH